MSLIRTKLSLIKVYRQTGEFLGVLASSSAPNFVKSLDGGLGDLTVRVDGDYSSNDPKLDLGNHLEIEVWDDGVVSAPHAVIYGGYVSQVRRQLGKSEGVTLTVIGYHTLLALDVYRSGTTATIVKTTTALGQVLKDILDAFNTNSSTRVKATAGYSVLTAAGPTVTYTFENRSYREAIDDCLQMATGGEHWYVDAHGRFWWKVPPATTKHTFVFGRHFTELDSVTSLEKVRNKLLLWNAATGGGAVQKEYIDAQSVAKYGSRLQSLTDAGATAAATAMDFIGVRFLTDARKPPITMTLTVYDSNSLPSGKGAVQNGYDLESIEPGDTCRLANVDQLNMSWLTDNMVITAVDYRFDRAILTIDVVKSGLDQFQRRAQRELDKLAGTGAPTTFSTYTIS